MNDKFIFVIIGLLIYLQGDLAKYSLGEWESGVSSGEVGFDSERELHLLLKIKRKDRQTIRYSFSSVQTREYENDCHETPNQNISKL